jgi:hypothetical protein
VLPKPTDVFDRDVEWTDLAEFVDSGLPGLRIALVYGRRRQGKSYLVQRLAEACGGLYHVASEQAEALALRRFAESLSEWHSGRPAMGSENFRDWEMALKEAADVMAGSADRKSPLLVLDEFPYLMHETQGLASLVQILYDQRGPGSIGPKLPLRLILCGSAISVMSDLVSGTKALRGRALLELRVNPFGYRDARTYWGIDNIQTAFRHNALLGGTPGYRELAPDATVPEDPAAIGGWLARNVLRPGVPLFDEADRVVHEDPRIREAGMYASVLALVAAGETSPTKVGNLLRRPASSLTHTFTMLESSGFIQRQQDLLLERRPVITITDPLVRLHHLIIDPYRARLQVGQARQVWTRQTHKVSTKIYGPHFETIAREWLLWHAYDEAGLDLGEIGQSTVPCREHRTGHEIDALALAPGARPRTAEAPIAFIGEAKCRDRPTGVDELRRLEHIRELLTAAGHDASAASLGLFSLTGFTDELRTLAGRSGTPLQLIDLAALYG